MIEGPARCSEERENGHLKAKRIHKETQNKALEESPGMGEESEEQIKNCGGYSNAVCLQGTGKAGSRSCQHPMMLHASVWR